MTNYRPIDKHLVVSAPNHLTGENTMTSYQPPALNPTPNYRHIDKYLEPFNGKTNEQLPQTVEELSELIAVATRYRCWWAWFDIADKLYGPKLISRIQIRTFKHDNDTIALQYARFANSENVEVIPTFPDGTNVFDVHSAAKELADEAEWFLDNPDPDMSLIATDAWENYLQAVFDQVGADVLDDPILNAWVFTREIQ
jgi:hypothetical protein